jgi:Histidine kinase-, DNA gyrase B-, and HSP90-like ATPase
MTSLDGFEMDSNVARDVLSTASSFGSLPKAVAEYVANSIGNGEEGQRVNVTVTMRRAYGRLRIVITDDACGMDDNDLRRFFSMHAENEARRLGRSTGGRFGTGKAAAFGVGSSLQVETCRNGRRWVVRLDKAEIEAAARDKRRPRPHVSVDGVPTTDPNGTTIIIDGLTKTAETPKIIQWLRRRSGRALNAHNVVVEGTRAVIEEPPSRRTWNFSSADAAAHVQAVVGRDVVCTISAAMRQRVDDSIQGVWVESKGFPVGQVTATGDHASRIFGFCEVPALEEDESTPSPYLDTRDYVLNEDNATAGPLVEWLRACLATVVSDLAAEEREQRRRAQDAALRNAASRMEAVLNRHYHGEFRKPRNPIGELGTKVTGVVSDENGPLVRPGEGFGGYDISSGENREESREPVSPTGETSASSVEPSAEPVPKPREHDAFGEGRGEPVAENHEPRRPRRSGGFKIAFENASESAPRSRYLESELLILVNLDHPELAAAYQDGDTALFRMLAFEAAAQEYSYATAYVRIEDDSSIDASDIVEYVRTTMESLTRDVADVVSDLTTIPLVTLHPMAASA